MHGIVLGRCSLSPPALALSQPAALGRLAARAPGQAAVVEKVPLVQVLVETVPVGVPGTVREEEAAAALAPEAAARVALVGPVVAIRPE